MSSPPPPDAGLRREDRIGQGVAWLARWSGRWILIAVGAVLLGYLLRYTWAVVFPALLAIVVCAVLHPLARLLHVHLRLPRTAAAAVAVVGFVLAVIGLAAALAPSVADEIGRIGSEAAGGVRELRRQATETGLVGEQQIDDALAALQDRLSGSGGTIAQGVLGGLGAVSSAATTTLVTLVLAFLFLKDGHRFLPWTARVAGPVAGKHLTTVLERIWHAIGGYIRAQALVSLIDAVLIGAALLLLGVPLAVPLAVITFAAGFIPIVGAVVAGARAVLIALVDPGPVTALVVLGVILLVQQLEGNVLSPWLQSRNVQLYPAVVLLGVLLGGTLFGVTGAFLAVPVAAAVAVTLRYLDEQLPGEGAVADDDA
jgi:putative heme transporter